MRLYIQDVKKTVSQTLRGRGGDSMAQNMNMGP